MKPGFVEFAALAVAVAVLAGVVLVVGTLVFDVVVRVFEVVLLCASVGVEARSVNKQMAADRGSMLAILLFTVSDSLLKAAVLQGKQDGKGFARREALALYNLRGSVASRLSSILARPLDDMTKRARVSMVEELS